MTYIEQALKKGYAFKGDTIEELAAQLKDLDNPELFIQTVKNYSENEAELKGPFYAVTSVHTYYATINGLAVNEYSQLLNEQNEPIPNLYGVGELIFGNAFSANYPGTGSAIGLAIYGGKLVSDSILSGK